MTIESATYINTLNASNPGVNDAKSEGDDHLRLIKSTVKSTFPNITGAMTLTQAELNALTVRPAFSAYGVSLQSISTGTETVLTCWTVEEFDTAYAFDSVTNFQFAPQTAGYYQINVTIFAASVASGRSQIILRKNGSNFKGGDITSNASGGVAMNLCALVSMNGSTDYLTLAAYQDSGFTLAMGSNAATYAWSGYLARNA